MNFAFRVYPLPLTDICHTVRILYLFLLSSNRHVESYLLSIRVENEGINFAFFRDPSVMSLKKSVSKRASPSEWGEASGIPEREKTKMCVTEHGSGGWLTSVRSDSEFRWCQLCW